MEHSLPLRYDLSVEASHGSGIPGSPQYRSLKYSDSFFDVDGRQGPACSTPERIVAHLTFDAARISSVAAGDDAFLQDFVEHGVMKAAPLARGEWPATGRVCGGRRGRHGGTRACRDPRRL